MTDDQRRIASTVLTTLAEGGDYTKVPWEWHDYPSRLGALGYSASAALVHRFV